MTKLLIEAKTVMNLGGYVVERIANLPYIDVIIGNPLNEDVKIDAPIYSAEDLEKIKKLGLFVEGIDGKKPLKECLEEMKKRVEKEK